MKKMMCLREEINQIDEELSALFQRRMRLAIEISKEKGKNELPVFQPEREKEVLERVTEKCEPALRTYMERLYHTIFEVSRSCQQQYLSPQKDPMAEER